MGDVFDCGAPNAPAPGTCCVSNELPRELPVGAALGNALSPANALPAAPAEPEFWRLCENGDGAAFENEPFADLRCSNDAPRDDGAALDALPKPMFSAANGSLSAAGVSAAGCCVDHRTRQRMSV